MKFNRRKLIKIIEAEITRVNAAARDLAERRAQDADLARISYVERTSAAWKEFAANIRAAVAHSEPITINQVPAGIRSRMNYIDFWEESRVVARKISTSQNDSVRDLKALLDVLNASDDETVSLYALQKSGFSLGKIVTNARTNTGQ